MVSFEVGKSYMPNDSGFLPITVLRRTDKTIWVDKDGVRWMMRIKHDVNGNEMVVDSACPKKWQDAFTYKATWEAK